VQYIVIEMISCYFKNCLLSGDCLSFFLCRKIVQGNIGMKPAVAVQVASSTFVSPWCLLKTFMMSYMHRVSW
jgi:hypothetical protein